ncbi:hypothetical protein OG756_40035 [Streptomyces sp. NBC_01310]|uniref:hypothetical protein n=1 Tax=Streptomyces sp. NBC_01310 TaxID=2903820 RepID=UPI0035B68A07|nr:hypothetical protein OG756_40035 [Streptomyces sp. NBC_01310]
MVRSERNGRAGGAASGAWRVTVLKHERKAGPPPYDRSPAEGQPLARREDLRIHGSVGKVGCTDASGRTLWAASCSGRPNAAHISGGRVLITTDSLTYTPWGHLGPALLFDLADGTQVAELRGARGAALPGGRFVLGLEGYDVFDTWEYDRDGALVDSWRSYGHYVVGTGIRVVETDRNLPTRSRVVRLLPGGVVEGGPSLTDPQAPRPLVLADGTILVLDAGVLRAVDRGLEDTVLAELLPVDPAEAWRYHGALRRTGDELTVTLAERHPDHPGKHTVHTWALALRQGL